MKKLGAGTVIMYEGKLIVAQEINVIKDGTFDVTSTDPVPIEGLTSIKTDNEGRFRGDNKTNSFTISRAEVYQVSIDCQANGYSGDEVHIFLFKTDPKQPDEKGQVQCSTYAEFTKEVTLRCCITMNQFIQLQPGFEYSFRARST